MLRGRSGPFIIVLGHPEYYPRFSFKRASVHGIASQGEKGPNEAFMIQVLQQGEMQGASGIARYRGEFDQAMQEAA